MSGDEQIVERKEGAHSEVILPGGADAGATDLNFVVDQRPKSASDSAVATGGANDDSVDFISHLVSVNQAAADLSGNEREPVSPYASKDDSDAMIDLLLSANEGIISGVSHATLPSPAKSDVAIDAGLADIDSNRAAISPQHAYAPVADNMETDIHADIQTSVQTNVQTNVQTDVQTNAQADVRADGQADGQADVQAGIQAGLQAGTQSGIQTETTSGTTSDMHARIRSGLQSVIQSGIQTAGPTDVQVDSLTTAPSFEQASGTLAPEQAQRALQHEHIANLRKMDNSQGVSPTGKILVVVAVILVVVLAVVLVRSLMVGQKEEPAAAPSPPPPTHAVSKPKPVHESLPQVKRHKHKASSASHKVPSQQ